MSEEAQILCETRGKLGVITLNRPRALNSLSLDMLEGIDNALDRFETDPEVAAVLIRGAGEKGLCAGGDIVSLYHLMKADRREDGDAYFRKEYTLNHRISQYPKPYISLMDGVTLGGGVGASAHGSHRIVTERTRTGMPETVIGFCPDIGGHKILAGAPNELGTLMAMTGRHVNAGDALAVGLADYFVPSDKLEELVSELESAVDTESVTATIERFTEQAPDSVLEQNAQWIARAFAGDSAEKIRDAVAAEAEKGNELAAEALKAFEYNSPTGIKMALIGVRRAAHTTLAEVLNADFLMSANAMRGHDLQEGIRALVIDKDRTPHWEHATLEEVSEEHAASFFEPIDGVEPLGL